MLTSTGYLERIAGRIVECTRYVAHDLPSGLPVDQYETALELRMRLEKLQFARQYPFGIPFYGPQDRGFRADFIVEGRVMLELARVPALDLELTDLALNYLRECGATLCLLINFGASPLEIRRILPSGDWSPVAPVSS